MIIRRGNGIAKKLGEHLLNCLAASEPMQAMHVALGELGDQRAVRAAVDSLEEVLEAGNRLPRITTFCMPNNDLFLFADTFTSESRRQFNALLGQHIGVPPDEVSAVCHIYDLPDDAIPLRRLVKTFLAMGEGSPIPAATPSAGPGRPAAETPHRDPPPASPSPAAVAPGPGAPTAPAGTQAAGAGTEPPRPGAPPARPGAQPTPSAPEEPRAGAQVAAPAPPRGIPGIARPSIVRPSIVRPSIARPSIAEPTAPHSPLEGPLTLPLLDELLRRLADIDIAPLVRTQGVYTKGAGWRLHYTEHFFNIAQLQASHFAKVDLHANEPLFVEFVHHLDDLMLAKLLGDRPFRHHRIGVNLSLPTLRASTFRDFSGHLDEQERRNVVCELHWLDILQDLQDGGEIVRALRDDGYSVAMDRVGMRVLPCLQLGALEIDSLKIRFERDALARMGPQIVAGMRRWPGEKVVLAQCDDRRALALGETLGIGSYQGRLIDQLGAGRA